MTLPGLKVRPSSPRTLYGYDEAMEPDPWANMTMPVPMPMYANGPPMFNAPQAVWSTQPYPGMPQPHRSNTSWFY